MALKRKKASREFIDDSDDPDDSGAKSKKTKKHDQAAGTSCEEELIPVSANRFIKVRTYNSNTLIDIREYYTDDVGEKKPGRKGISLNVDQWKRLKKAIPEIDAMIEEKK